MRFFCLTSGLLSSKLFLVISKYRMRPREGIRAYKEDFGQSDEDALEASESKYKPGLLKDVSDSLDAFAGDLSPEAESLATQILEAAEEMYADSPQKAEWNDVLEALSTFIQEYPHLYSDSDRKKRREDLNRKFEMIQN